jgi:DDE superfamily endonuclease
VIAFRSDCSCQRTSEIGAGIQTIKYKSEVISRNPAEFITGTLAHVNPIYASLFAALDTKTDALIGQTQRRHRSVEFRNFLDMIEKNVPADLDVHLILDNYGTRKTQLICDWPVKRPRFHLHFTPTSASWLQLVEPWFALLTEKQLGRAEHRSTNELENAIRSFIQHHNKDPRPFVWHKAADQILDSVARFCARTLETRH